MKFVCERCHTKYSIADEKVRGKVLKVRCKSCENVITVRETGATIDDAGSGVPKEAPHTRSGTLDARTGDSAAIGVGPAGRRVNPEPARRSAPSLPAAALVDPHGPAVAPPRRPTPRPMPALSVDDGVEWYLAVDGAQTGPFRRPVLIDKILAVPPGGDVHVWNANLGSWKPPKDVPDVSADLARRRRPSTSATGNARRPSGAMPIIAPRPVPTEISEGHSGSNGVSAFGESEDTQISSGPPVPWKRNGVAPAAAAKPAAKPAFGMEDMFGEEGDRPAAAATAAAAPATAAASSPALPAATASSVSLPLVAPAAGRAGGRPVRLIFGAVALAVIVCGIVAVVMLRKPAAPVATAPKPAPTGETNFANLAEKLANEQAAEKPAEPPPAPPVVDEKPVVAKVEPPVKGGRGKGHGRSKGGTGSGLSPTSPPPLTEEQQRAAARFGESSPREVRAPSGGGAVAHSMPAQADISRVINNNRQGIQTCYQRALLRDSTLTQGKVTVRVSIGISGKVKSVSLDAPAQFRSMESCVRDVMSRWAFPPSSEEYGTEFPVVLQGNQ